MSTVDEDVERIDTSDVDKYVGKTIFGGQLKEPVTVTDIRRWVQALDYPNAIHFDETAASRSSFGDIIAPQSFTVNCDVGHGSPPAMVGKIPGSHTLFGGDEWWFYGPRIRPGDKIRVQRRFDGYKISDTKFAGPSMFTRGDTLYVNQRNEPIGKQRTTKLRYVVEYSRRRSYFERTTPPAPTFTTEQLAEFARLKREWILSGDGGGGPGDVVVGDALPTRVIGPHSISSFTTEHHALIFSVWGSHYYEENYLGMDLGWLPEFTGSEGADPAMRVGMNEGPASAHINLDKAKLVGLPRRYGYGSSMGSWVLDYLAYWAGDTGFIRHSKIEYRSPVLEHDFTLLNAEVVDVRFDSLLGAKVASVNVVMTNQDGVVLAKGPATVELSPI